MIPFRRRGVVDLAGRLGLARALSEPTFELLPLKSAGAQSLFIPEGTWVSVTASPSKGLDATIDLAVALEARGYRAIAHLSARMIRDRAHLRELLTRLLDGGVDRAFVVGGDSPEAGSFPDGLSLLREIADNNSFEQRQEHGSLDAAQRANKVWKRMLAEYEAPPIDPGIDEALTEFIAKRKASFPDSEV